MALAEHEITQHEITQHEITQQLISTVSRDLSEKVKEAALLSGQTINNFVVSALMQATEAVLERHSATPAFGSDLLDHTQEEADVVLFTSYDGTLREVGALPSNLGRATALVNQKVVGKIWGTSEEEAACRSMQKAK